jgi:hypothetical protein
MAFKAVAQNEHFRHYCAEFLFFSIFFFGLYKSKSTQLLGRGIKSKILLHLSRNKTNSECLPDL